MIEDPTEPCMKITINCSKCHEDFVILRKRNDQQKLVYWNGQSWQRKIPHTCGGATQ
jgi:hypothetical protein